MNELSEIDVLDMIIDVLNEHEKKIDALIRRFEEALEIIEKLLR